MQCVVVKSLSVKGVQTTDEDVHYLAKGVLIPILHCLHTFQLKLFFIQ